MAVRLRVLVAAGAAVAMTGCAAVPLPQLPDAPDFPGIRLPWQNDETAGNSTWDDRSVTSAPTTTIPSAQSAPTNTHSPASSQAIPAATEPVPTQQARPSYQAEPTQNFPRGGAEVTIQPTVPPPPPTRNDCQPSELEMSFVDDPSASRAGYSAYLLWMTNTSSSHCEISGFPGVDFALGPSGLQVGRSGAWDRIYEPQRFSLAPGQRAAAEVRIVHAEQLPGCQPTRASYVKVIAPNTWVAYLFPVSVNACTNPDIKQLTVRVSRKVG